MSAAQIFTSLLSLALIGFAITVIEHARVIVRGERASRAPRDAPVRMERDGMADARPGRLRG